MDLDRISMARYRTSSTFDDVRHPLHHIMVIQQEVQTRHGTAIHCSLGAAGNLQAIRRPRTHTSATFQVWATGATDGMLYL